MRKIISLNKGWLFSKKAATVPTVIPNDWEGVDLPHCWNAVDGQDGGNDYYRGTCWYAKMLRKTELPEDSCYYLEICGANSSASAYLNGKMLAHHDGGYSIWRVRLPNGLPEESLLVIAVDNGPNDTVYPQVADFTFYGGLYRNVNILCVAESHFDLDYYGGSGLKVTPQIEGKDAEAEMEVFVSGERQGQLIRYSIQNGEGEQIVQKVSPEKRAVLEIPNVHLWNGRKDPYLYSAKVELLEGGEVLDCVEIRFGCRTFQIDPERGFLLNGEEYPLRGVARHQDRWGIGNALLLEHHREDMDLICEMGATTIRLAHYQHDQYFYDLCDERGMVVWAEIPYISRHMPGGRENTLSQLTELIVQNYHHPSIVVWGLSNEITMDGADDPDLLENHRMLNDLAHKMDKTRLTTIAVLSMCNMDEEYVHIPDVVSYNHYFGWYGGETSMNGSWFDQFHEKYPNRPIGCSEYGCEALNWHSSDPMQGDYTEEYQAHYHEELIKQFFSRKYLWATHVWNMFDFGADGRNEGGEDGQNHKGLVTFDRKYKKDAFYAYKAWLSDEPFVHICGKRYVDRVEDVTRVTVYSNEPEVELFANGKSLGRQNCPNHFFYFEVPNTGETRLLAVAGAQRDESVIRKVEVFNEAYRLREKNAILNWFDITEKEGRFSLNDKISEIMTVPEGRQLILDMFSKLNTTDSEDASSFSISEDMMQMLGGFTVLRLIGMMGTGNISLSREELLELNKRLNQISKETEGDILS